MSIPKQSQCALALAACLLTSPSRAAGSAVKLWSQPLAPTTITTLSRHALDSPTLDLEAADDFQVNGSIGKVVVAGSLGFPAPPPAQVTPRVRFYAHTPSGSGALQAQHLIPMTDAAFAVGPNGYELTLPTPFVASGRGLAVSGALQPQPGTGTSLLRRVFGLEVLCCPTCSGRRRIVVAITQGAVIRAILESLGLPTAAPAVASARGPPELSWEVPAE